MVKIVSDREQSSVIRAYLGKKPKTKQVFLSLDRAAACLDLLHNHCLLISEFEATGYALKALPDTLLYELRLTQQATGRFLIYLPLSRDQASLCELRPAGQPIRGSARGLF